MRYFEIAVLGLLLGSCVPDSASTSIESGRYTSYRDLLVKTAETAPATEKMPTDVREQYARCSADFVITAISPADLANLDEYARGQRELTVGESKRIDESIRRQLGKPLIEGDLSRLNKLCPESVPGFQKYLGVN